MQRKRNQADFQQEIQAHMQLEADQLQANGMSRAEAEAVARRTFGNRTRVEERFYESRRSLWWDHLVRDLRFAARLLAKDPRFSVLAILGLALGIGISTAIFTMIYASVNSNRVAEDPKSYFGITRIAGGRVRGEFSYLEYSYFRDHATCLHMVSAESGRHRMLMIPPSGGEAQEVQGRFESANFLAAMGLRAAIGRTFSADEELEGAASVALLNYRSWQRRFGGDPSVLGRSVTLNAHPLTIVGVAGERFGQGDPSDFYLPLSAQPLLLGSGDGLHNSEPWLMLDVRLRPGYAVRKAESELQVLHAALRQAQPSTPVESGDAGAMTLTPGGVNPVKAKALLAMVIAVVVAVSMILLVACSNLANLLLARAVVRQREIGVRLSLGASRGRLVAQLLTESMLLALGGGSLGLVFSHWLANVLMRMASTPGLDFTLKLEPAVVWYAIALSVATGLSFGLAPAVAATRTNLAQAMHGEGLPAAAISSSRRVWSARNALVIVPLAVSLMLLLSAGIAVRRAQRSTVEAAPQFDASRVIVASFRLNMQGYNPARTLQFQDDFRQRMAAMPGVTSVAFATAMPLSNGTGWLPLSVEGREPGASESGPHADYNVISPEYFQTIGSARVRGREFTSGDREGGSPVVIVNQDFVRHYWPNENPIGKRIRFKSAAAAYAEVIGVAPDLQDADSPDTSVRPTVYIPYAQSTAFFSGMKIDPPPYQVSFLARTAGNPADVKKLIRQQAHAADASLRTTIETVRDSFEARLGPLRTLSMLLSALGGLALLMAAVGIYAILAYAVSQRTREIGIRAALGARRGEVVALLMRRTTVLIAWGIVLGLAGAFVLTRVFAKAMSEVGELDVVTCVAVSGFLAAVALLASYLPARKALRVDPAQALRCE